MADAAVATAPAAAPAAPAVVNGQAIPTATQDAAVFEQFFGKGGEFDKVASKAPVAKPAGKAKASTEEDTPHTRSEVSESPEAEEETEETEERLPLDAKVDKDEELEAGAISGKTLAEARKALAKGDIRLAFKLAFGKHPEFFNVDPQKSFKWRKKVERETAALDGRKAELDGWADKQREWVAKTNEELKFPIAIQNIAREYRQTGDSPHLGKLIEHLTGESLDVSMKKLLRNERSTPGESRLQKQLAQTQQKLAELEGKMNPQQKQATPEEQAEAQKQVQQEAVTQYLQGLQDELKGHKALKLEKGVQRVYQVLRKSWDPVLKAPSMSPDEAADEVIRLEKVRVQKTRAALGEIEAIPEPVARKGARPLTRANSTSAKTKGPETEADIFERSWRQVEAKKVGKR